MDTSEWVHRHNVQDIFGGSVDRGLLSKPLHFLHEPREYNVVEFFNKFESELPKLVMISGGFYGDVMYDTFDREQVIRIHNAPRMLRVLAQQGQGKNMFSIPISYQEPLCVVDSHGKYGRPYRIQDIIRENRLPVTVGFPEGVMCQDVIPMPLYLSRLCLSLVKGIENCSPQTWIRYQEELDRAASYINYDVDLGNRDFAVYQSNEIQDANAYLYIQPSEFASIIQITDKARNRASEPLSSPDKYPEKCVPYPRCESTEQKRRLPRKPIALPVHPPHTTSDMKERQLQPAIARPSEWNEGLQRTPAKYNKQEDYKPDPKIREIRGFPLPEKCNSEKPVKKCLAPPFVRSKPEILSCSQLTNIYPSKEPPPSSIPPPLPERKPHVVSQSVEQNRLPSNQAVTQHVSQMIQVSEDKQNANTKERNWTISEIFSPPIAKPEIQPVTKNTSQHITKAETRPLAERDKQSSGIEIPRDLAKLSIDDVSNYMRTLRLDVYIQTFRDQLIDGKTLLGLDDDMLLYDIGMKKIEALRLMNFIKEGYLPF